MMQDPTKEKRICTVCGCSYAWRRKWERDWRQLRYCSKGCSSRRLSRLDYRLEEALLLLLEQGGAGESISPDEAARFVDKVGWASLQSASLNAARRLSARGAIELIQEGAIVSPDQADRTVRARLIKAEGGAQAVAS